MAFSVASDHMSVKCGYVKTTATAKHLEEELHFAEGNLLVVSSLTQLKVIGKSL